MSLDSSLEKFEDEITKDVGEEIKKGIKNEIGSIKNSKTTTSLNIIKPSLYLSGIILNKTVILIIVFFFVIKYFSNIFILSEILFNFIIKTFNVTSPIGLSGISLIINLSLLMYIFTFLIIGILGSKKTLSKWIKTETTYLILGLILLSVFITYYESTYTPEENYQNFKINLNQSSSNLWEKITCSFSPSCIQKEMNSNKATTVSNTGYKLKLKPPSFSTFTTEDLKYPLELDYQIQSSGEMKIIKIECYLKNKKSKPFYTEELNQIINTDNGLVPLNLKCDNLEQLPIEDKETKLIIIPILTLEISTSYEQEIPIVDYNEFIKSENLNPDKEYSFFNLKTRLDKITEKDKIFKQSNNALKVDNNILKKNLPLLIGNNNEREFSFPLIIEKNSQNNFGKFIAGTLSKLELPTYLINNRDDSNYEKTLHLEKEKYEQRIYLKENENENPGNLLTLESLKFSIISIFENENRFEITIKNENYIEETKETNENQEEKINEEEGETTKTNENEEEITETNNGNENYIVSTP